MKRLRPGESKTTLKEWLKSHSVAETAMQLGVQRDTIYKAVEFDRQITLHYKDGVITYAYETKPAFKIFNS